MAAKFFSGGENFARKADRQFIAAVERDVSISPVEAERLAEIAAIVTDCSGTGQLVNTVHPNFAGDYATSNSDHFYTAPTWAPAMKAQQPGTDQGMIVIGANRGDARVFYSSGQTPIFNAVEIDQVLSVPPGAALSVWQDTNVVISINPGSPTVFMSGLLKNNAQTDFAMIPCPNDVAPNWAYVMSAGPTMTGTGGSLMNVRVSVTGNTCVIVYRIWVRGTVASTTTWTSSNWAIVDGSTFAMTSVQTPTWQFYGSLAAASNAFAIELCSTDGSDAQITCELFPGASGGDPSPATIIQTVPSECILLAAPVSWWGTVASVMGNQIMLGAQEIITCTASQFNNQGTVVAGKLSKGCNLSYVIPQSDFFVSISQIPRNTMTGALKDGASGFHIPDFTDRGAGAYDITQDDVRYYLFRSTPNGTNPLPTMLLRVYSNVSYGVTSQIIPTFPVEPVPHVYALFAILSAIDTMGTNEGHLRKLFDQAKRLKNWILSPAGRKTIGQGFGIAKDVAKFVAPIVGLL